MKICKAWAVFALGAVAAWGQIPGFETNTYEVFSMPSSAFPSAINTPGTILSSGSGSGYLVRNGAITPFLVPASDVGLVSPRGMNDNEDVVGEYQDSAGKAIAFAAIGGKFQLLTEPGGRRLEPRDINQNRTIVGTVTPPGAPQVGFILKGGSYSFVNCTDSSGQPVGTVFSGINRNGAIAGWCLGGEQSRLRLPRRRIHVCSIPRQREHSDLGYQCEWRPGGRCPGHGFVRLEVYRISLPQGYILRCEFSGKSSNVRRLD